VKWTVERRIVSFDEDRRNNRFRRCDSFSPSLLQMGTEDENITTCQLVDQCRFTLNPKYTYIGGERRRWCRVLKVEGSCV